MGIKNVMKKVGDRAGNKLSKLSSLSSEQLEKIQLQREEYLLQMPDPTDENAVAITQRMMAANSIEIFNSYLAQIKDLYLPIKSDVEYDGEFDANHNIRYFNITKWVVDKNENSLEKLINVYAVLADENCNIALVFNRTQTETDVYLAVVNNQNSMANTSVENYRKRLLDAIKGNFPGAECKVKDEIDNHFGIGVVPCLNNDRKYSVATASNIPTEKSKEFVSQTIEKLLDGIVPESRKSEYTIILLATPITDVEDRKIRLGEIHSGLSPYSEWSTNYTYTENNSIGSSATVGVNVGASAGIQNGTNSAITENEATAENSARTDTKNSGLTNTKSSSDTITESNAHSDGISESNSVSKSRFDSIGVNVGGGLPIGASYTQGTSDGTTSSLGKTASDTLTRGLSNTVGNSIAKTTGTAIANTVGKAVTKGLATTAGLSHGVNFGGNVGANFARSSTITAMIGKNEGITQNFENYNVKHALELLENQMKRFEQSTALGMWDFAAYVLSEDSNIANNVAHSYLALTLGEESYMSKSAINLWKGAVKEESSSAEEICNYLRCLRHPQFGLNPEATDEDEAYNVYPAIVTATTSLSGKELAYSLNFPRKSVSGLPVFECAEFGRNVVTYDRRNKEDRKIDLGKIFHMYHQEPTIVNLSLESLKSHAFITGSTGSGKSNTVYHILNEARLQNVKFLVVEPAKGEYKNIFGNDKDVSVYGTNPKLSQLLRINPFSFSKNIHVLEHCDRLIEIFNVCWPMYAAMPAVLKSAVEKSYLDCGWDMITSCNKYRENIYPTFSDVTRNVKEIIDSSEYDAENKGAYKGSLLTRLQSLCNGINGMIFSADELDESELFDHNAIVDLSRVGSSETKSLIMGMLVLKLQEYRLSTATSMNAKLNHITVLEEAHNLLRRTSAEQSSDSSNLLGKSVEMLSNAIAEMRTYGEGFIIADQAPGLMDMSVIRNTNTKIILRLPEQSDRELVGRAANLNEDQINELAKLPCGVAAIYQNEWIQPVLCRIELFDTDEQPYVFNPDNDNQIYRSEDVKQSLLDCIMENEIFRKGNKNTLRDLKIKVIKSKLDACVKVDFLEYIQENGNKEIDALRILVYDFLSAESAIKESKQYNDIGEWSRSVAEKLEPSLKGYSDKQIDLALALILYEQTIRDASYESVLCRFTEVYNDEGGVY